MYALLVRKIVLNHGQSLALIQKIKLRLEMQICQLDDSKLESTDHITESQLGYIAWWM